MAVSESGHLASEAIDDLYRRHGTEVYRYAFAVLGNHADAEDVTQTTFLNAYRSLEQGVHPRKPANWLLTIASNAIKQRFRMEQARPRVVELDERTAGAEPAEDDGPTVGELLAALSKIPPQQRQAIVLREFEGRSYVEIADILGVTTGALETLLFRARRSLAEELEQQLTCTEAQLAISRAADDRLGRKERRRLREHLAECPDCSRFASVQKRHRRALKGLMLLPVPLSLSFAKGLEGTATAATLPAVATGVGAGVGTVGATGGGALAGGAALKAAAVVTAATVATGVALPASSENGALPKSAKPAVIQENGQRLGQTAPRGVLIPGNGVARGKPNAPGTTASAEAKARAAERGAASKPKKASPQARAQAKSRTQSSGGKTRAPGQSNNGRRANQQGPEKSPASSGTKPKASSDPATTTATAPEPDGSPANGASENASKPNGSATEPTVSDAPSGGPKSK
jgi:RNA polymerase sigma factor (sigma-70 family)